MIFLRQQRRPVYFQFIRFTVLSLSLIAGVLARTQPARAQQTLHVCAENADTGRGLRGAEVLIVTALATFTETTGNDGCAHIRGEIPVSVDDPVEQPGFVGDYRSTDREWAEGLGLCDRLELVDYLPRSEALRIHRDSEALLLLIPEAGGRGRGVLSGKVFEYISAERPFLAVVPPDGAAA
jgi:hypothetical protein